jgi:hypothetical protein
MSEEEALYIDDIEEDEYIDPALERVIEMEDFIQAESTAVLNFKEDVDRYVYETYDAGFCKHLSLRSIWEFLDRI